MVLPDDRQAAYSGAMTVNREELHYLVDMLSDLEVDQVLSELRQRVTVRLATSDDAFAWIGAGPANNGRADNASRVDHLLGGGFGGRA